MEQPPYLPDCEEMITELETATIRFDTFPHLTQHLSEERKKQLRVILLKYPKPSLRNERPRLLMEQLQSTDMNHFRMLLSRADERLIRLRKQEELYLQELTDLASTKTRANFLYLPMKRRRLELEVATLSVKMICEFRILSAMVWFLEKTEREMKRQEGQPAEGQEAEEKDERETQDEKDYFPLLIDVKKWNLKHVPENITYLLMLRGDE
jgi:hypothetical protein